MISSRHGNRGWSLSLVIICVAVALAPPSDAYSAGQSYPPQYGTVVGIVSPECFMVFAPQIILVKFKAMETNLLVCIF